MRRLTLAAGTCRFRAVPGCHRASARDGMTGREDYAGYGVGSLVPRSSRTPTPRLRRPGERHTARPSAEEWTSVMSGIAAPGGPAIFDRDREDGDRVIVIEAAGTPQESREMRRLLMEGIAGEPQHLFVDLRRVEDLSSQGFAALVGVRSRQVASRRRLTLVCDSRSSTVQVLARSGMGEEFTTVTELPGL